MAGYSRTRERLAFYVRATGSFGFLGMDGLDPFMGESDRAKNFGRRGYD
jgi:hypothetical protein